MAEPTSCIQAHPNAQTIWLRGKPINVRAVARSQGLDHSYVCKMMRAERDPGDMSVKIMMGIAAAVGMGLEDLIAAIYERRDLLARRRAQARVDHHHRAAVEQAADTRVVNRGQIPIPRMPISP